MASGRARAERERERERSRRSYDVVEVEVEVLVVRGLTEVWELKGEGPCWKGLGLWPSGVAGDEPCRTTRPTGWMAPGRVCRGAEETMSPRQRERFHFETHFQTGDLG